MSYFWNVSLISIMMYLIVCVIYFFYYMHYINLKNRRIKLPDPKHFLILSFVIVFLSSAVIISSHYINQKNYRQQQITTESYTIKLPQTLESFDANLFLETIKQKVQPHDGELYIRNDDDPYINIKYDESIRDMYMEFFIIRNNKVVGFTIDYNDCDDKSGFPIINIYKTYEHDHNEYSVDQQIKLEQVILPLENVNFNHMKEALNFSDSKNFIMMTLSPVPNHYEFDSNSLNKYLYNQDQAFEMVNETNQLKNSNVNTVISVTKMIKLKNSGYRSSDKQNERVEYFFNVDLQQFDLEH
ncbi:hypothetical protein [Haloplasma contractile]|uniref:Uncharacterized protein n=1 Tax=Haloplasma contractile SSD-17B TaxID=1033810 RepID=U2FDD2_9MOLU|nr:hypothetical protein [Haloplasma contractile]ERJ11000.1 hypothetical protein HLPCO_002953 [Haloplasma contractile SSD-17B]